MLMTETNTPTMRAKILRAANYRLGRHRYQADFEHGQWWVTRLATGAQWSVVDCSDPSRSTGRGYSAQTKMIDYLDFEQVTQGDED